MEERVRKLIEKHKDDKDLTSERKYIKPGWDWSHVKLSNWLLGGISFSTNRKPANLMFADFDNADLTEANLTKTDLTLATFFGANLTRTNLSGADLSVAHLYRSDLSGANLFRAELAEAKFTRANLTGANLSEASILRAYFFRSNLSDSKLINADLRYSDLRECILNNADITGSKMYMVARDGWKIENIKCKYIYMDPINHYSAAIGKGNERYPRDRDFEDGEFEKLYKSVPTIEYVFKHGMSWVDALLMDYAATKANQNSPQYGLKLVSIDGKGYYPTAKFEINDEKISAKALEAVTKAYEQALSIAEKDKEFLQMLLVEAMKSRPRFSVENANAPIYLLEDNAQVVNINIEEFKVKITSVQKMLESAPDAEFKGKGKQFALDTLSNILGDLGSEAIQKTAPKLLKKVIQCLGPALATQVVPILQGLIH